MKDQLQSNWRRYRSYFREFIMIFLAVFCGFLAEYKLEDMMDKQMENEFVQSLLYDLQKDSAALSANVIRGPQIIRFSDSLVQELQKRPLQGREKRIHFFLSLISENLTFKYYDRTVTQLRFSGGFRLLSKLKVSDAVLDYDVLMREAQSYAVSEEGWTFLRPAIERSMTIFDMGVIFKIYDEVRAHPDEPEKIHFPENITMLTYDDKAVRDYINLQLVANQTDMTKYEYSRRALEKNIQLTALIRREYGIE